MTDSRLLLPPREAAWKLGGISLRHLWSLTAPRGPVPVVRLGRRVFYRPQDLAAFLERAAQQEAERAAEAAPEAESAAQ
ncbi:MAG TPA: hypothetical protein PLQ00_17565 [Thermoguttaceae bacterium]|nr:hypothetical protein [Thermoguttaceae bacterium]